MLIDAFKYAVARKGVAPSEFWRMSLEEFWWLIDAEDTAETPCSDMPDEELSELYEALKNGTHRKVRR